MRDALRNPGLLLSQENSEREKPHFIPHNFAHCFQ